ncbi:hypothetical protein AB0M39_32425 [Streptomyces sp. NPDC051907]|uniref:hypothetical protein n=1 Tax=Streptomyces sp. NPDC051907 TaxID=3155284 RepID=UPI003448E396
MTFTEVDGGTHVCWTTHAEIPVPLLGAFLTRRLARPIITRTFHNILDTADRVLAQRPPSEAGMTTAHTRGNGDASR